MRTIAIYFGFVTVFLSSVGAMAAPQVNVCSLQREALAAHLKSPGDTPDFVLKIRKIAIGEAEALENKRACLKTYASQFPGGLDRMATASPEDLKSNLDALRSAFSKKKAASIDDDRDLIRIMRIEKGWEREQVLLWGTFWLTKVAYKRGDYDFVLSQTESVRREFGLNPVALTEWDNVQEATYFSPQALRNIILGVEYMARVRKPGNSKAQMKAIVDAYLKDREAIVPLAYFVGNPDAVMFRGICGNPK